MARVDYFIASNLNGVLLINRSLYTSVCVCVCVCVCACVRVCVNEIHSQCMVAHA